MGTSSLMVREALYCGAWGLKGFVITKVVIEIQQLPSFRSLDAQLAAKVPTDSLRACKLCTSEPNDLAVRMLCLRGEASLTGEQIVL